MTVKEKLHYYLKATEKFGKMNRQALYVLQYYTRYIGGVILPNIYGSVFLS